jgi:hypothetical protein
VRPWHPYRSKWEAEYARYLEIQKAIGRILEWEYEPERLEIGAGAYYTPDFRVRRNTPGWPPRYEWREVKGYKREAAMVRLKVAAKMFSDEVFVLVTKKNLDWIHTPIK